MIDTSDFRKGLVVRLEDGLYRVVDFQHVKPGKGGAFVRARVKNVETGAVFDRTFRAGEKFEEVMLEHRKMQYLYRDGETYVFMDQETYEQIHVDPEAVDEFKPFLVENQELGVLLHQGRVVTIEMPASVNLEVVKAEPWLKGDTTSGATKPVTLKTGLVLQVPLFVEEGEVVKVDTRTGEYLERI